MVSTDDVARMGVAGLEYWRPEVPPSIDRPLAAIGTEHHRRIVEGFGDDGHRPCQFTRIVGQVRQQFDYCPPGNERGGHGLDVGVAFSQPGRLVVGEVTKTRRVAPHGYDTAFLWITGTSANQ